MKKDRAWLWLMLIVFGLGVDFWNWNRAEPLLWGIPFWVVYLFAITLGLTLVFLLFARRFWKD